jgi:hypothetical protein
MRKRNEAKGIQGWGWLGDAAEEAAVEAMAPARSRKNGGRKRKSAAGLAQMPVNGSGTQLSDGEYRRLAKQQHESQGKIEIDPRAKVSRSEDETGEIRAYVQAWVFVHKPERR